MEQTKPGGDAFITGIDAGGANTNLLDQVRMDNEKMKQIVGAFSNKVETLIDKQRNEYIQAYEGHMQEVQKELHSLREKVADIANDETKNEKTETLKQNQKKYKEEALKLESDSDEILKKIKKLVRKVYTVEKSRDWMLKRLRQAKQEYNTLIKERNRLFEDWDTRTMSQSLASMSNASSYTLDLRDSLKEAAIGGLKLNTATHSTQAHSRVQVEFSVKRQGSMGALPALSAKVAAQLNSTKPLKPWDNLNSSVKSVAAPTAAGNAAPAPVKANPEIGKSFSLPALQPATKSLSKSKSGPALLVENFANGVNNFGVRKSRGSDSSVASGGAIPVAEQAAEDVEGKLALARLIALRARRQEVRQFLRACSKSLHRGPWCRVKARPLDALLEACQDKIADSGRKFRSEELLQLVCELAVYPETYEALAEIFDSFVPLPANYMSDEEIEATAVVRSPHRAGTDTIADELLVRFGDFGFSGDEGDSQMDGADQGIEPELSDVAVDFRDRISKIVHNNGNSFAMDNTNTNTNTIATTSVGATSAEGAAGQPSSKWGVPSQVSVKGKPGKAPRVMGGTLDKDLKAYFAQEGHTRHLSNLGFFERDNFMDFD